MAKTKPTDERIAIALERMASAMEKQVELLEALTFISAHQPPSYGGRRHPNGKLNPHFLRVFAEHD